MNSLNYYGLLIGLAVVLALELTERALKKYSSKTLDSFSLQSTAVITILGGVIGARVWHVITDFHLYQENIKSAFYIWNGGVSILGALLGGVLTLWWWLKRTRQQSILTILLDALAISLPFSQAVGRFGNYFNQELFGIETTLPWAIELSGTSRHPLFAYEAVLMLVLGWWLWLNAKKLNFGKGWIFSLYLISYGWIRFWLDFLRAQKTMFAGSELGLNQVIILIFIATSVLWVWQKKSEFFKHKHLIRQLSVGLIIVSAAVIWMLSYSPEQISENTLNIQKNEPTYSDHQVVQLQLGERVLNVEIVNSAQSITQGLSGRASIDQSSEYKVEGMLFIFPDIATRNFWMKDMQFNLDMVWMAKGEVVGVTADVPHPEPNTPDEQLPIYRSPQPVNWVLELYSGMADHYGITTGMNGMITPDIK